MANKNQKIAAQLQALAASMEQMEDEDLLPVILDACGGLMAEVQNRRPAASQMDPIDLAGYTAGYTAISSQVGHFADDLRATMPGDASGLRLTDSMAELEQLRAAAASEEATCRQIESQIQTQRQANAALEADAEQKRDSLKRLTDFYQTLLAMSQGCTPEIIARQEEENRSLLDSVTSQDARLKELEAEKGRLDGALDAARQKIAAVQTAIDALPQEQVRLVQEYDAMQEQLRRLQNAEVECSPENQEKLTEQIEALRPQVEQQETRIGMLRDHYNQLSGAKSELDREKQTLETNILDLIQGSLGELTVLMEEHRGALIQTRKEADTFRQSLAECRELRSGYDQWFGSNRMELESMLAALDRQENMELRTTLCVTSQGRIQELFRQAERALGEVDQLLQRCAEAARQDLAHVERLAGGK